MFQIYRQYDKLQTFFKVLKTEKQLKKGLSVIWRKVFSKCYFYLNNLVELNNLSMVFQVLMPFAL